MKNKMHRQQSLMRHYRITQNEILDLENASMGFDSNASATNSYTVVWWSAGKSRYVVGSLKEARLKWEKALEAAKAKLASIFSKLTPHNQTRLLVEKLSQDGGQQ